MLGSNITFLSVREMDIQRRVKVFSFGDSNVWEDLGTGYVTKDYIEVTRGEVLTITVRSEYDGSIIIQSKVLPERPYKVHEVIDSNTSVYRACVSYFCFTMATTVATISYNFSKMATVAVMTFTQTKSFCGTTHFGSSLVAFGKCGNESFATRNYGADII